MNIKKTIHDAYAINLMQRYDPVIYEGGPGAGITAKQDRAGTNTTNSCARQMRAGVIISAVEEQEAHITAWLKACYTPDDFFRGADVDTAIDYIYKKIEFKPVKPHDLKQCKQLVELRVVDARWSAFGGKGISLTEIQKHIGVGTGRWYSSMSWRDTLIKAVMNQLDSTGLSHVIERLSNA